MKLSLVVCLLALGFATLVHSAPATQKLRFKISGKELPDKDTGPGTTDGYVIVYWSTDNGKSKTKIGRTDTINDKENPDWSNVFDFDFDRSKNQMWFFHVYDDDTLREDDNVGRAWVNVADYVDKGQMTNVKLDKQGYLTIKSADAVSPPSPGTPIGQIPLPPGTPESQTLKFKVAAAGLATKDDVGFIPGSSDPYVIITTSEGITGKEKDVGRTSTQSSTGSPTWGDVFTINWDRKKDQYLHFKIYDDDKLREDDKLGKTSIQLNDYVARGQTATLILPKQGVFYLNKA